MSKKLFKYDKILYILIKPKLLLPAGNRPIVPIHIVQFLRPRRSPPDPLPLVSFAFARLNFTSEPSDAFLAGLLTVILAPSFETGSSPLARLWNSAVRLSVAECYRRTYGRRE
jgi:hypothetical protein